MYTAKQTKFSNVKSAAEALDTMQANFEVAPDNLITLGGSAVETHRAIVRTDTNKVLGIVGNRYMPVQNTDAFAFFDAICKSHKAKYQYGYVVNGGSQIMLQAKIGSDYDVRPGDTMQNYITLVNGHDGIVTFQAFFTPRRLSCANQCRGAIKDATESLKVRHTKTATIKMEEGYKILAKSMEYFEHFKTLASELAQKVVDQKMIDLFLKGVFGETDSKQSATKLEAVNQLIHTGKGNTGKSAWDMYNGVTEWIDHYRYSGKEEEDAKNIASAILTGVDVKEKAWEVATSLL
jgi:phage/plasmid-like protein (TIGR03299 family)